MSNNWRKYIFFIYLLLSIFLCSCNGSKANKQVDDDSSSANELVYIAAEAEEKEEYLERIHIPVISSFYMKGVIDEKYTFTMRFTVDSGKVDGVYRYKGKEEWITIKGTIKGDNVRLEETIYNGQKSVYVSNGTYFDGKFDYDNGTIKGTWHSADGTRSLPFKIENYYNTGYPQFDFKVNLKRNTHESGYVSLNITELYILNKKTGSECCFSVDAHPVESVYAIIQEDFNFDGYPDIAMMEFIPSYPPDKFLFWIYDPDEDMYYSTDILDDVYTLPEIDYTDSTTTTYTSWRGELHEQTYKFNGKKWTLIKSETSDISG